MTRRIELTTGFESATAPTTDIDLSSITSEDVTHTQADTGDWTVADGSSIDENLDELADRVKTLEDVTTYFLRYSTDAGGALSASTQTDIVFEDSESIDNTGGIYSTSTGEITFTTATAGTYFFYAHLTITNEAFSLSDSFRAVIELDTGGGYAEVSRSNMQAQLTGTLNPGSSQTSTILTVANGDKVKVTAICAKATNLVTNGESNFFMAFKIA